MKAPRRVPLVLVALVLVALLPGCAGDYDNPFEGVNLTQPPPPDSEIGFVSAASGSTAEHRDLFAADEIGTPIIRLTTCSREGRPCDLLEASWSPERTRAMVRRRSDDTNGDSRLTPADGESLVFMDLARGTEAVIIEAARRVTGVDWSPIGNAVVYSALGGGRP